MFPTERTKMSRKNRLILISLLSLAKQTHGGISQVLQTESRV